MTRTRTIDSLDSKHMMSIIMFLRDNGPARRTDIYDAVSRNSNMPEKIGTLMGLGLVANNGTEGLPQFSLTETGSAVAEHLSSIESLMETKNQ